MSRVFKPRYPSRNSGFWFAAVSLILSYGLGALLVIGIINNNRTGEFNLGGALIVLGVTVLAVLGSMVVVYQIMRINPQQVVLEEDRLLIQKVGQIPPQNELEIPFAALTLVRVTDVPVEGGLLPLSFKGILLRWQPPAEVATEEAKAPLSAGEVAATELEAVSTAEEAAAPPQDTTRQYVISSRNVCDFDDLFEQVFAAAPKEARGARIFRA